MWSCVILVIILSCIKSHYFDVCDRLKNDIRLPNLQYVTMISYEWNQRMEFEQSIRFANEMYSKLFDINYMIAYNVC